MVHTLQALHEVWRVLVPDGIICNILPPSPLTPFAVVLAGQRFPAGNLDMRNRPTKSMERVYMAIGALAIVEHEGRFTLETSAEFSSYWYWDTFADADTYYGTVSTLTISDEVRLNAQNILDSLETHKNTQVSTERLNVISRYRKSGG